MHFCRGGKLAGEGASQRFDPKEIGGMLKQNIPDYFKNVSPGNSYQGEKSKP